MPPKRGATPSRSIRSATPGGVRVPPRSASGHVRRSTSAVSSQRPGRKPKRLPEGNTIVVTEGMAPAGIFFTHSPPVLQRTVRSSSRHNVPSPARRSTLEMLPSRPSVVGSITLARRTSASPEGEERKRVVTPRVYRQDHTPTRSAPSRSSTPSLSPRGSSRSLTRLLHGGPLAAPVPSFTYSFYLNGKAGTVFVEIARQLAKLPFWNDVSVSARNEVAAARSLHGQVPSVSLLLEDRYVTDRITANWHRHQRGKKAIIEAGKRLANSYNGTKCLTLKAAMIKTFRNGVADPWSITPQTFILNAKRFGADERRQFMDAFQSMKGYCHNIWIAKPSHRNKGIGIKVFDSISKTLDYIDNTKEEDSKATQYVLQKYIERPFLIHGRKFDLRSWCVLTPEFDIHVYREGVMRTASEKFSMANLDDELSHLTNHCIQETGPNFGRFEEGNEMWYGQFQEYLDRIKKPYPGHKCDLRRDLLPQVNSIIIESLLASKRKLTQSGVSGEATLGCFQLFGFDFMVDEDMKVWLIEINGSPASAEYLLEGMMADLIKVIVEPAFPAPPGQSYDHSKENNFQCIYKNPSPTVCTFKHLACNTIQIDRPKQPPAIYPTKPRRHPIRNRAQQPLRAEVAEEHEYLSRRI